MTPYQYTYQNPIRFTDPTGMEGEEVKEPPIKEIRYFRDNTGEYFWNKNQDAYEHYISGQDGYSYYEGMYSVDESKKPVGDYSMILQDGKEGELAKNYTVKVTQYEEMSSESVDNRFSIDFEINEIISTKVIAREKGALDTKKHTNNYKVPAKNFKWYDWVVGRKNVEYNTYEITGSYESSKPNISNKVSSKSSENINSTIAEKLGERIFKGLQNLKKK